MIPPSTSSSRIFRPNSTGLPALNRGTTCVCGSNSDSSFSGEGTGSFSRTRRSAWRTPCLSLGRTSPSRSASRPAPGSSSCRRRASSTRLPCAAVRFATATSRP